MKTSNKKQSTLNKVLKTIVFLGIISIIIVFALNSESSLGGKYTIHSSDDSNYGREVSYINLTGERSIEEKKIKLSEGYWTSGKFNF